MCSGNDDEQSPPKSKLGCFEVSFDDEGEWDADAPETLDGSPVDKEEAARVHAGLLSGEVKIEIAPCVAEEMEKSGLTVEDLKEMLIQSMKKTMQ